MTRSISSRAAIVPVFAAAAAAGFVAGRAMGRISGNLDVPEPCKPVDLQRYLGRWYEIGRYDAIFETGCEGVTAEYSLRPDGLIQVVNTCRRKSPDGRPIAARARAKVVPNTGNAKLRVSFFGPFYIGLYWVMDHGDDYEWSIVGEPTGMYLWLLSREPVLDTARRDALVERARQLGYDTDLIRFTRQPPG